VLFKRKHHLRKDFDEKLLKDLSDLKKEWLRQKEMYKITFSPSKETECELKLSEMKYFYLFKEAKYRKIKSN
jgi:hypothetical protein